MAEKKNIYQKLLEIQKQTDYFQKDTQGYNYKYTSGSTVLGSIRPLMNTLGVILKQEVVKTETTLFDVKTKRGEHKEAFTEVYMRFTWVNTDAPNDVDVCEFKADGCNDPDKALGSALTYAERYFLLKYFHIPTDTDDPDYYHKKSVQKSNSSKNDSVQKSNTEKNDKDQDIYKDLATQIRGLLLDLGCEDDNEARKKYTQWFKKNEKDPTNIVHMQQLKNKLTKDLQKFEEGV